MATLLEMKTRIRLETNKDDIASGGEAETALTTAITQAIEYYSAEPFWFNHYGATTTATASTTATVDYVAIPATIRIPQKVSYLTVDLEKVDLASIEALTDAGQPSRWAPSGDNIALWPVPDAVYALTVYGISKVAIPASDGASNIWTTEALDLICARARFLLYRDIWFDKERMLAAAQAEGEALSRLQIETRRRTRTNLRHSADAPWRTNYTDINLGA